MNYRERRVWRAVGNENQEATFVPPKTIVLSLTLVWFGLVLIITHGNNHHILLSLPVFE